MASLLVTNFSQVSFPACSHFCTCQQWFISYRLTKSDSFGVTITSVLLTSDVMFLLKIFNDIGPCSFGPLFLLLPLRISCASSLSSVFPAVFIAGIKVPFGIGFRRLCFSPYFSAPYFCFFHFHDRRKRLSFFFLT